MLCILYHTTIGGGGSWAVGGVETYQQLTCSLKVEQLWLTKTLSCLSVATHSNMSSLANGDSDRYSLHDPTVCYKALTTPPHPHPRFSNSTQKLKTWQP